MRRDVGWWLILLFGVIWLVWPLLVARDQLFAESMAGDCVQTPWQWWGIAWTLPAAAVGGLLAAMGWGRWEELADGRVHAAISGLCTGALAAALAAARDRSAAGAPRPSPWGCCSPGRG